MTARTRSTLWGSGRFRMLVAVAVAALVFFIVLVARGGNVALSVVVGVVLVGCAASCVTAWVLDRRAEREVAKRVDALRRQRGVGTGSGPGR